MKYKFFSKKNIIWGVSAIVLAICLLSAFCITVDFPANKIDLILYRISGVMLLATLEIGVLLEMNLFNLRKKIPLIKSRNIFKHILFWVVVVLVATILFSITYNATSADFRNQLNKSEDIVKVDNDSKDVDKTEATDKSTEKENQQVNVPNTSEDIGSDKQNDSIESNVDAPQEALTWRLLSQEKDRYKLVLTLLGENFNTRTYIDTNFSDLASEEQRLVKELFDYADRNNTLPTDFTETFTAFCVGDEFENMFFDGAPNSAFYNSLSNSFVISWKSDDTYYINIKEVSEEPSRDVDEFVTEESPFTYVFDETEHIVGNCSVVLKKIEIVNTIHKASPGSATYAKHIRIQATVKNNSSQETYLTSKKDGQFFIGKYYGTNEETKIGWNNNYKWKVDSGIKSDYGWTLKPNQTRDICVSGVFIDYDRLKYSDSPQIDLYFVNDGDTLTISIN